MFQKLYESNKNNNILYGFVITKDGFIRAKFDYELKDNKINIENSGFISKCYTSSMPILVIEYKLQDKNEIPVLFDLKKSIIIDLNPFCIDKNGLQLEFDSDYIIFIREEDVILDNLNEEIKDEYLNFNPINELSEIDKLYSNIIKEFHNIMTEESKKFETKFKKLKEKELNNDYNE